MVAAQEYPGWQRHRAAPDLNGAGVRWNRGLANGHREITGWFRSHRHRARCAVDDDVWTSS